MFGDYEQNNASNQNGQNENFAQDESMKFVDLGNENENNFADLGEQNANINDMCISWNFTVDIYCYRMFGSRRICQRHNL